MKPKVKNIELQKQKFIEKSINKHGNLFDYSKVDYVNSITKVEIICKEHGSFFVRPDAHIRKVGCSICNGGVSYNQEGVITKFTKIHGNRYNYSKVIYINSMIKVEIICKEHGSFLQTTKSHILGQGCPKCSGKNKKTTEEFCNESVIIHNNEYDYSLVDYKNNRIKVNIICSKHGLFNQIPKDHLNGSGCPKCNKSKGEIMISNFLESLNIKYFEQYKFEKCKNYQKLSFDFYLPDYNICIEYDGRQHFEHIFGYEKDFLRMQENDNIKNKYCFNNNIRLIRIKYFNVELDMRILKNILL